MRRALVSAAAAASLAFALPALAGEGHEHHDHAGEHGHADTAHFEAKEFATVKDAWAFIAAKVPEAESLAAAKSVDPLHELAEQIGSAVHALEEKSGMVEGDAKTKLAAILKQLDKAADDLHHAAEEKDADGAALSVGRMKGLLPVVESLYPAGALK